MKFKAAIASIIFAVSATASASCMSLVSNQLDEVSGAVSEKATSASAISMYLSTCELYRDKAIYKMSTMDEVKSSLSKTEKELNAAYQDVGTVNYIVGVKAFATFTK